MPNPNIICFHLNQLGDLVFSLPALFALRMNFPTASIVSVARPPHRELLLLSGLVDDVFERPKGWSIPKIQFLRKLHAYKPDLAVLFSSSFSTAVLAFIARPREKAGFRWFGLTYHVPKSGPPSVTNNLRLVEALGCSVLKRDYVGLVKLNEEVRLRARSLLKGAGLDETVPYVVIAPSASRRRVIKQWKAEAFAEVARRLAYDFDVTPVLVGASQDKPVADLCHKVVDLSGKTSVAELAAVLEGARAFVGIDSGAMHLAAALGTPVVALFGPTDPAHTGPMGEGHSIVQADSPCLACMKTRCNDPKCMQSIEPEHVLEKIAVYLSSGKHGSSGEKFPQPK